MHELSMPKTNQELMQLILNRLEQLGKARFWLAQKSNIGGPLYHHLSAKKSRGMQADNLIRILSLLNISLHSTSGQVCSLDCVRNYIRQKANEAGTIKKVAEQIDMNPSGLSYFIRYKNPQKVHSAKFVKIISGLNFKLIAD